MPLSTEQQAEIDQARDGAAKTLRPIAPARHCATSTERLPFARMILRCTIAV